MTTGGDYGLKGLYDVTCGVLGVTVYRWGNEGVTLK